MKMTEEEIKRYSLDPDEPQSIEEFLFKVIGGGMLLFFLMVSLVWGVLSL